MRRIILSLGAIVFVGAIAAGATGAFFNDSETSTGNTFTAGAIDLTVDSTQHYNGNVCALVDQSYVWQGNSSYPVPGTPCDGTWTMTNLGPTNKFFNFGDVKPGDYGEDTISLHIDNNPAWACADIKTTSNEENGINGPEAAAGDVTSGPGQGELAQNVTLFAWLDNATATSSSPGTPGDNIWQAGEPILYGPVTMSSLVGATTTLPLADPSVNSGDPLPPTATDYIGLAWCAGTMDTSNPGTITCSGAAMNNLSQTDSATADVTLRVEQSRNNSGFRCIPNVE